MLALGSALLLFSFLFFFSLPLGPFSTSDKRLADGRMTRENDATYPHAIYQPPPHKRTPEPGALFGITMLIVRSMPRKMPGKWKKHREWANRWVSETVLLRIKQFFFLFSFFREMDFSGKFKNFGNWIIILWSWFKMKPVSFYLCTSLTNIHNKHVDSSTLVLGMHL